MTPETQLDLIKSTAARFEKPNRGKIALKDMVPESYLEEIRSALNRLGIHGPYRWAKWQPEYRLVMRLIDERVKDTD